MVEITHLDASPDTRVPKASVRAADGTAAAATLGLNFASSEQRGDTLVVRIRPDEWYLLGDGALFATPLKHSLITSVLLL